MKIQFLTIFFYELFREEQADEYTSLKKELEQTTKNCRILSFKLRKAERRTEQLEAERQGNTTDGKIILSHEIYKYL